MPSDGNPSTARALVLLDTDDVHNVHTALTARDMDPELRIIVQMVNPRLGKQLHSLLGDCVVISGPSLAAPAFVVGRPGGRRAHLARASAAGGWSPVRPT